MKSITLRNGACPSILAAPMDDEVRPLSRIDPVDAARGCAIFLMIFVNFAAQYPVIPSWSKHAAGIGFTYVDAIAPGFVLVMGASAAVSFRRRREAGGAGRTALHALRRHGLLFFFGCVGTAAVYAAFGYWEWNIFQTLAVAGAFGFPFLFIRRPVLRLGAGLLLMAGYQALLTLSLQQGLFAREPAPLFLPSCIQALSLATLFIIGSALGEWMGGRWMGPATGITAAAATAAGLLLRGSIPPNRGMGSVTYLLLGLGAAAGCLFVFWAVERLFRLRRIPVLSTLGRNSLVIFMIASVLTKVMNALLPETAGPTAVLSLAALLEAFCLSMAIILDRRAIHIKL
jgi:predicted acyltransferase